MEPLFIVFEGVDGSGKSEISLRVAKKLGAMHLESPLSPFNSIRKYVDDKLNDKGRFLFYLASNFDLSLKINHQRKSNSIVCARYFYSTIVGYASRQSLDIEMVCENIPVSMNDFEEPDLTIFLYVNEDTQRRRIRSRATSENSKSDFKCLEDEKYRQRLFDNYTYVSKENDWYFIDTSLMSIDEVVDACIERIIS